MTIAHRDNPLDAEIALALHFRSQRRRARFTRIIGIVLMVLGAVLMVLTVLAGFQP